MMATRPTRTRKRPPTKCEATTVVRRQTVVMNAIPEEDVINSAKVGVEALLTEMSEGTVFVQANEGPCWRITVEIDLTGGDC